MQENVRATRILGEVLVERDKQDAKWGEQNHPSVSGVFTSQASPVQPSVDARNACNEAARDGALTWAHIANEEFAEAIDAPNDKERREELVQLAAVITAWIECIDRRKAKQG